MLAKLYGRVSVAGSVLTWTARSTTHALMQVRSNDLGLLEHIPNSKALIYFAEMQGSEKGKKGVSKDKGSKGARSKGKV